MKEALEMRSIWLKGLSIRRLNHLMTTVNDERDFSDLLNCSLIEVIEQTA